MIYLKEDTLSYKTAAIPNGPTYLMGALILQNSVQVDKHNRNINHAAVVCSRIHEQLYGSLHKDVDRTATWLRVLAEHLRDGSPPAMDAAAELVDRLIQETDALENRLQFKWEEK